MFASGASDGSRSVGIRDRDKGDRKFAVLRGVEGALEIVDFGADMDAAREGLDEAVGPDASVSAGKTEDRRARN